MALAQAKLKRLDDIYALPDGQRAELIDGQMYMMAPPNTAHQKISWKLHQTIANYIDSMGGNCDVFAAPFAVFLNKDDFNYVEPDLSVICDRNKINDKGCSGAPDWIIEIVSPSTQPMDYGINVYDLEHDEKTRQYSFNDNIPVCIYENFSICISGLL